MICWSEDKRRQIVNVQSILTRPLKFNPLEKYSDMREGYVYIVSNECMPGLIKIGRTCRSMEERLDDLSKPSSTPVRFKCEYVVSTIDSDGLEKIFHAELEAYRINPRREFFKIDLEHAIAILKELTDYD